MNEWIQSILTSDHSAITVIVAVFLMGVISVFVCACNFAIIGATTGYAGAVGASGKTKSVVASSLFFLLGNVIAMSAIGCLLGYAGEFINASMGNYWKIAAGVIFIFFGVYILDILPFKIPGMSFNFQNKKSGIVSSALFGFLIGAILPLSSICCNPFFHIIIAASIVKGSTLWGFLLLFTFALGHGLILAAAMLGFGLGVGKVSKLLSKSATVLKYVGGIALIIFGFYFLLTI
jgi:cytochrome c biogenesis protein CcdA